MVVTLGPGLLRVVFAMPTQSIKAAPISFSTPRQTPFL
jgi:hypothetical protein